MLNRGEATVGRERIAQAGEGEAPLTRQQWWKAFGVFALMFVAAVVAGIALSGCGQRTDTQGQAQAMTPGAGDQGLTASAASMPGPAASQMARDTTVSEALPPDVTVTLSDTLVSVGQPIELVAEGTSDVTQIVLSDGLNDSQPFVRDAGTNTWRASYRVPLRPRLEAMERFGLSITARNGAERWRRVWVFLRVHKPAEQAQDNPDEIGSEK